MTVKELREKLQNMSDDLTILICVETPSSEEGLHDVSTYIPSVECVAKDENAVYLHILEQDLHSI